MLSKKIKVIVCLILLSLCTSMQAFSFTGMLNYLRQRWQIFWNRQVVQDLTKQTYMYLGTKIVLVKDIQEGNIVSQNTDAIVNAAKESLLGGGGIDGAIHRAAGNQLRKYCKEHFKAISGERCSIGQVRITPSFNLSKHDVKYILHTVGPRSTTSNREKYLKNVYQNIMRCIKKQGKGSNITAIKSDIERSFGPDMPKTKEHAVLPINSIAIPAISVGRFVYPIKEAVPIVIDTILEELKKRKTSLKEIVLVFWPGGTAFDKIIADKSFKEHVNYFKTKAKHLDDLKLIE